MPTVIQAGKTVHVLVALAYRLVLGPADIPRWSTVVEKVKALGKVGADLSENQSTEPGRQKKQTCCGETQHLPSNHQMPERTSSSSSSLDVKTPLPWTQKRLDPFIYDENSSPVGGFYPNFPCYMVRTVVMETMASHFHRSAELETIFSRIFSAFGGWGGNSSAQLSASPV